jgi:hypothetical protein
MHAQLGIDHGHPVRAHLAGADRVIHGAAVAIGVVQQLVVGLHVLAGKCLLAAARSEHGRVQDLARQLEDGDMHGAVLLVVEIVRRDGRCDLRIGRACQHATAAERPQLPSAARHARLDVELPEAALLVAGRRKRQLQIRTIELRP